MNRGLWLLGLCVLASGCVPLPGGQPAVGQPGILVSTEKNADSVLIYSDRFGLGFESTPDGTKADYLGEAPDIADAPNTRIIRVAIRSGKHEGKAVATFARHWRPIDR